MADKESKYCILFVDDEPQIKGLYEDVAEEMGTTMIFAGDGEEALAVLEENKKSVAMIVSDYKMPGLSGMDLRQKVLAKYPDLIFVLVSGYLSKEDVLEAMKNRVATFIEKPFDMMHIVETLKPFYDERVTSLEEDAELLEGFVGEAEMLLEEVDGLLTDITVGEYEVSIFDRIFAIIHTIKGAGGFFHPLTIHHYAHSFEDFLTLLRDGVVPVSKEAIDLMHFAVDKIVHFVEDLSEGELVELELDSLGQEFRDFRAKGGKSGTDEGDLEAIDPVAAKDQNQKKGQAKTRDEVKVSISDLDEFMEKSGEITVLRNMIIQLVRTIEKTYGGNKDILLLAELLDEMHKVNSTIQEKIVDLRKVPMKTIYRPLARVVRELAPKLKKKVEIECLGEEILVDTSIAEVLNSSLMHMIKNCLDHGVETPEIREERAKNPVGTILLRAEEVDDRVVLSVQDDGGGLDPERIKDKMLEKGMKTEAELEAMEKSEVLESIFEPGFSTSESVTEISGRGVGTDMLKGSVEKIGGKIEVESELGQGTQFTLHLPIPKSVVIINSLFVEAGREVFAIPQDDILRIVRLDAESKKDTIFQLEGGGRVMLDAGIYYSIIGLRDILGVELAIDESDQQDEEALERVANLKDTDAENFVLVRTKKYEFILQVDGVLDIEDTVVKAVKNGIQAMDLFQGATFLGDGCLGLILSMDEIAKKANVDLIKKESISSSAIQTNEIALNGSEESDAETHELILFQVNQGQNMAADMKDIYRLEEFDVSKLQKVGDQEVVYYRNNTMPLFNLATLVGLEPSIHEERLPTLIIEKNGKHYGFIVDEISNLSSEKFSLHDQVTDRDEIRANLILEGQIFPYLDIDVIINKIDSGHAARMEQEFGTFMRDHNGNPVNPALNLNQPENSSELLSDTNSAVPEAS